MVAEMRLDPGRYRDGEGCSIGWEGTEVAVSQPGVQFALFVLKIPLYGSAPATSYLWAIVTPSAGSGLRENYTQISCAGTSLLREWLELYLRLVLTLKCNQRGT